MKVLDVYNILNKIAPCESALSFDNVGILIGDRDATVTKAVVCLDCTFEVVKKAVEQKAELIITHHPVIFEPLKSVLKGSVVYECVLNNISVISMHTNLDSAVGGVNDCLANALGLENVVSVTDEEGFSFRKGVLSEEMSAEGLARYIKSRLGGAIRYTDNNKLIKTVCVCGGSGGSELFLAMNHADAFITADVKHNVFMDAAMKSFSIFDAGHFHTENVIVEPLSKLLGEKIKDVAFLPFNGKEIKTV